MNREDAMNQPIGYWARQVDQLFTARMDAAIAGHGITRLHWQVLNGLHADGPTARATIAAGLAPFADPARIEEVLADLAGLGWVAADETVAEVVALTGAGRAGRAAVYADVSALRERAMQGIDADEYTRTIGVLQRLAENLS
ncbi:MAG: hypothetical protein AUI14_02355 [Actinobacteria bacterium 13_2_20CM_2_71_6]|nr:MAG: hypothetical protein AUI14_02355 [Actinobacteria bacterium 13_2_20CM_2_71_6]